MLYRCTGQHSSQLNFKYSDRVNGYKQKTDIQPEVHAKEQMGHSEERCQHNVIKNRNPNKNTNLTELTTKRHRSRFHTCTGNSV